MSDLPHNIKTPSLSEGVYFSKFVGPLLDLTHLSHQLFIVRFLAKFVGLGERDLTLFIHNEDGSVIDSGQRLSQAQDAKLLCYTGVSQVIAQKCISEPANRLFLPGEMAVN